MSDVEESVASDGVGVGEIQETPAAEVTPTPEEVKPEPTLQEKIEKLAADKAPKAKEATEKTEEAPAYNANFKFNVLDKQHEIPKEFQALIKDDKSEKMVREIFEKAYGLDSVKSKAAEVRTERDNLAQENAGIKQSIDGLRSIYQSAASTGNWMKLDDFFARLKIPEQHIMQWALTKVNFSNLPADQQQMIKGNIDAEKRAELADQQAREVQTQAQTTGQQLKQLQLDFTLAKPEIKALADSFDAQVGKPGAFREQVINLGNLTWLQKKTDLSPEQAAQQVIASLGLKAQAPTAPAAAEQGAQVPPAKKVIVRDAQVIPNIQGRSSSPLKAKPRSIEDLKELSRLAQQA